MGGGGGGDSHRLFSSMICLGSEYDGSMMAEDQWQWLEGQLRDSEAAVHVLVSSLQVMITRKSSDRVPIFAIRKSADCIPTVGIFENVHRRRRAIHSPFVQIK